MKGSNTRDAAKRRAAGIARTLVLYGLLVGGSAVFALPFLWMVGTSFKVDREMFTERLTLFPGRPIPAQRSPFLDQHYYAPTDLERYERVKEVILQRLQEDPAIASAPGGDHPDAEAIVAQGIYTRIRQTLPASVWEGEDAALHRAVRNGIDPQMVRKVVHHVSRALRLGSVRVRSFDLQEQELTDARSVSSFWTVDGESASLKDVENAGGTEAVLAYDFSAPGDQEVTLSATLELPFESDRLFRTQISLTPDDGWHAIDFFIEYGGRRYQTKRPEYTGTFLPKVVTLQELGPDDAPDASKIKLWLPYREIASGPEFESRPGVARVQLVLRENGPLDAWWAKCSRNYTEALNYIPFWRYAATSVLLVILNVVGTIFSCSLAAYAFARLQWPGRNLCFGLMLATMMIPPQVTMIPYFLIMKHLGWYNTLNPLWVISFFGNAFNIFLLRQFMMGIPRDLEDAAKIDGCNFLQIYWNVIMPLIRPTLACIGIFTFMAVWNDFMGPLIYLSDQRLYPLSLGLFAFNVQMTENFNYGMMMAAALLMTLPVILLFFFAQKYFIQGIALTGTKG